MISKEIAPRLLVSVDPGSVSSWAFWKKGLYLYSGMMAKNDYKQERDEVETIARLLKGLACEHESTDVGVSCEKVLVIENQFLGNNPSAHKSLIESRMRWQVTALLLGWEVETIPPATWQSKTILRVPGDNTKVKSIRYAEGLIKKKIDFDHIADAICLGNFYLMRRRSTMTAPKQGELLLPARSNAPAKKRSKKPKQGA